MPLGRTPPMGVPATPDGVDPTGAPVPPLGATVGTPDVADPDATGD